jgi:hypothetical protein
MHLDAFLWFQLKLPELFGDSIDYRGGQGLACLWSKGAVERQSQGLKTLHQCSPGLLTSLQGKRGHKTAANSKLTAGYAFLKTHHFEFAGSQLETSGRLTAYFSLSKTAPRPVYAHDHSRGFSPLKMLVLEFVWQLGPFL